MKAANYENNANDYAMNADDYIDDYIENMEDYARLMKAGDMDLDDYTRNTDPLYPKH